MFLMKRAEILLNLDDVQRILEGYYFQFIILSHVKLSDEIDFRSSKLHKRRMRHVLKYVYCTVLTQLNEKYIKCLIHLSCHKKLRQKKYFRHRQIGNYLDLQHFCSNYHLQTFYRKQHNSALA